MSKITNEVIEYDLLNGMKILIREQHSAPVASSYLWYRVGSRNENPGITGVSHWVEHMMFKGTEKLPKDQLKRMIEGNGGRWNAFTSNDYTAYFETLPADKIEIALELEADRMRNCLFEPAEVEAERTVILSEKSGYENSPQFLIAQEIQATAYKAHPYQWGIIGWESDLKSMTFDDLHNYYIKNYIPNNSTLVIVGDVDPEDLIKKIETHFGPIPPGEPISDPTTIEPSQLGEKRITIRKEGFLAYTAIAYHIPKAGHDDLYPLDVLGTIMSSGKTARLYKNLIDQQIATDAHFDPTFHKDDGLMWAFAEGCDGVSAETLENALLDQIDQLQNDLVSDVELQRAINKTEANFIFSLDSVSNQAARIGYYETIITHKYLDTYLDRVRAVTAERICEVSQKYFTEKNRTIGHFIPILPTNGGQINA